MLRNPCFTVKRFVCSTQLVRKNTRTQHLRAPSVAKEKDKFVSKADAQFSFVDSQADAESIGQKLAHITDFTYRSSYNQLHSLRDALELHLEMGRFLNFFGPYFVARIDLSMTTDRKGRYRQNVRDLVLMPHYFDDGPTNNVILICQRPQHLLLAKEAGCFLYGFEDILKRFQAGDILDYNYDYLLCTPDVYPQVLKYKKKISSDRLPTFTNGRLVSDVKGALERYTYGKTIESSKIGESAAMIRANFGNAEMPIEHLCDNFTCLVNEIEKMHSPPSGTFVQFARISIPPSCETFAVDLTDLLVHGDDYEVAGDQTVSQ